jgi:hypothetical protein
MRDSFRDMARRSVQARENFRETLQRIVSGLSDKEADAVTSLYLKNKIAKLDWAMGRISVTHGAFLDAGSIKCAANLATESQS